jgi:hypothetical protein
VPTDAVALFEAVERDATSLQDLHRAQAGGPGADDTEPIINHEAQNDEARQRRP